MLYPYSGVPTAIQPGVQQSDPSQIPAHPLLGASNTYQYPRTSALMSSLSQPGAISGLMQNMGQPQTPQTGGTLPQDANTPAPYNGPDYSQIALQMAGNPHAGPYAAAPVPTGSFISNPATASSSGSSTGSTIAASLLGILASNPNLAKSLGSLLGNGISGLLGNSGQLPTLDSSGVPIYGSAADTGSLGGNPIGSPDINVGDPGDGLNFDVGNIDLSGATDQTTGDLDSLLSSLGFSGAGGQAAVPGSAADTGSLGGALIGAPDVNVGSPGDGLDLTASPQSQGADMSGLNSTAIPSNLLGSLGLGAGAIGALLSGKPTGQAQAGLDATKIAANNGLFGANSGTVNSLAGAGGNALGLYAGLQNGGVTGDTQAAVNAAALADKAATASGLLSSGAGGAIGTGLGYVAAPLALYNAATNWQSGATGSDALNGTSAGAAVGSIFGPVGTVVGGAIGAGVGALSSLAGGGKPDPETTSQQALDKAAPGSAAGLNPSQSFQYLTGIMDAKNDTAGHSEPIEQVFGRMGESNLVNQMAGQINTALGSGAITATTPASQVYSQVVAPWLASQGAAIDPNSKDVKGNNEGQNLVSSLQNLIGAYMGGQLNSSTPIGVNGQADSSLPLFSGLGPAPTNLQGQTAQQYAAAQQSLMNQMLARL